LGRADIGFEPGQLLEIVDPPMGENPDAAGHARFSARSRGWVAWALPVTDNPVPAGLPRTHTIVRSRTAGYRRQAAPRAVVSAPDFNYIFPLMPADVP
jgi:hypothetical protein